MNITINGSDERAISGMLTIRQTYRKRQMWGMADRIRAAIEGGGYLVVDRRDGSAAAYGPSGMPFRRVASTRIS